MRPDVFIHHEDAERFIAEVRGDDPEVAALEVFVRREGVERLIADVRGDDPELAAS